MLPIYIFLFLYIRSFKFLYVSKISYIFSHIILWNLFLNYYSILSFLFILFYIYYIQGYWFNLYFHLKQYLNVIMLVNISDEIYCLAAGCFWHDFDVIGENEKSAYNIISLLQNISHFKQSRRYMLFKKKSKTW